jgi:hypothetical protein
MVCPWTDIAQRRSTTRSVKNLETSNGLLEPSNGQSTGMRPDVEIALMAVGGRCSIRDSLMVRLEDVVDINGGFNLRSN